MKPLIFKGSAVALVTARRMIFPVNYEELDGCWIFIWRIGRTPSSRWGPRGNPPP